MSVVTSTVNLIRSRALNHRKFQEYLKEIDAEYGDVIYHTEVRWLSRGNVLQRFVALKTEIQDFLRKEGKIISEFDNEDWLCDLAFLTDVTFHLNILNKNLQGKDQLITDMFFAVVGFKNKLKLFNLQMKEGNLSHFPTCQSLFPKNEKIRKSKFVQFGSCLEQLITEFDRRFSDLQEEQASLTFSSILFWFMQNIMPQAFNWKSLTFSPPHF